MNCCWLGGLVRTESEEGGKRHVAVAARLCKNQDFCTKPKRIDSKCFLHAKFRCKNIPSFPVVPASNAVTDEAKQRRIGTSRMTFLIPSANLHRGCSSATGWPIKAPPWPWPVASNSGAGSFKRHGSGRSR